MRFIDPKYIRETVEEEALKVKTGIRSGDCGPDCACLYNCPPDDPFDLED